MVQARELFTDGLLEGRVVVLAGPARPGLAEALVELGAETRPLEADLSDEARTELAAAGLAESHALVVDAAARFAGPASDDDELAPLRSAADGAWAATRAVANAAWIGPGRPGRVVLVAPRPDEGPHAEAARAAPENMARTLSIEWSRYGIKPTAITPGVATTLDDVAALVAYLLSPAGDYFSGCRLDLAGDTAR